MHGARTIIVAAALLAVGAVGSVKADQPGPDWMSADQVKERLAQSGYERVTKLEADDGRWEGEGLKSGRKMEFHADPKTGQITHEQPDD